MPVGVRSGRPKGSETHVLVLQSDMRRPPTPRKRPVKCPECGAFNAVDLERGGRKLCVKCEADLTELATPNRRSAAIAGRSATTPAASRSGSPGGEIGRCQVR